MELSPNQILAVTVLACGGTNKQAAAAANVTERTVEKWRAENSAFPNLMESIALEIFNQSIRKAVGAANQCVEKLISIVENDDVPVRTQIKACEVLLNHGEKLTLAQVQRRIKTIEQALEEDGLFSKN
jgi:NAD/NADP transhydrogenase beta subunit